MITKTLWVLTKPDADETDAIFISSLGCIIEVDIPEPMTFSTHAGTFQYNSGRMPAIKITTTCEKQEMMLYLKYGDALRLVSKNHTMLFV
jgi:hypothetical protein